MNDSEINRLIIDSPSRGHRALFDEYYSYVYAITVNILRGCGSAEDVEECVIDAFASIIKKLDLSSYGALKPFIGTVAKNKALSMRRTLISRYGNNVSIDSDEIGELSSEERVDTDTENSEMAGFIMQKIKELGEPDSSIIIQKYFYERNATEIGRMVNMNPATVRMRCARAMKKLRGLLGEI